MSEQVSFTIVRPGGNDTALFVGIPSSRATKQELNDAIMRIYPSVEQVGFVNLDPAHAELQMAGGEFCGNATRATAWQILKGQPGDLTITVSGVDKKLKAGVTSNGEAYAQIPVYPDLAKITKEQESGNYTVEMEGIVHYIDFDISQIRGLTPQEIKEQGLQVLKKRALDRYPAAGVMYTQKTENGASITPIVYVRDANTLFYETACGSGTAAVGLACTIENSQGVTNFPVLQPSGYSINVSVVYNSNIIGYTQIQGPVTNLHTGTLECGSNGTYAIEQIRTAEELGAALTIGGLQNLYAQIFAEAPYHEKFEEEEIKRTFSRYVTDGLLFIARDEGNVIGFGAAVPLYCKPEIADIIKEHAHTVEVDKCWYMADLGVDSKERGQGIAKKLVSSRIDHLPTGTTVLMRTSLKNASSRRLYEQQGFTPVEGAIQEVNQSRVDGTTYTDKRFFLVKKKT